MRTIALICFLFILHFNIIGQTYNEFTTEATELYQNKNYQEASKFWDKAFNIHSGLSSDYYNAACTNALAGNKNKAFTQLQKAIKKGWEDIDWLKKDSDLASLRTSKKWTDFNKSIPELKQEYLNSLNLKMKQTLENLRMQDQTIRLLLPDAEKRFGRESEEYKWFRNVLMPRNDSVVLSKITNVLQNKGWMGISEVGELANQTLWLVIQHAPLNIQEKYLPLLEKSATIGESKARYLAFLKDRILMRQGKKQIYGTQSLWNKEKSKNVIWAIADYKTVNQRRKKVGLESIEDYAKNNGYLFDIASQNR